MKSWAEMTPEERRIQMQTAFDGFRNAWDRFALLIKAAFTRLSDDDRRTIGRLMAIMDRTPKERIKKKLRRRIARIIARGWRYEP